MHMQFKHGCYPLSRIVHPVDFLRARASTGAFGALLRAACGLVRYDRGARIPAADAPATPGPRAAECMLRFPGCIAMPRYMSNCI